MTLTEQIRLLEKALEAIRYGTTTIGDPEHDLSYTQSAIDTMDELKETIRELKAQQKTTPAATRAA